MSPDHSIQVDTGTVLIEFSPLDEWETLMEVAEKNIAELTERETDS